MEVQTKSFGAEKANCVHVQAKMSRCVEHEIRLICTPQYYDGAYGQKIWIDPVKAPRLYHADMSRKFNREVADNSVNLCLEQTMRRRRFNLPESESDSDDDVLIQDGRRIRCWEGEV